MTRIRYALLLPLLHLAIVSAPMFYEESKVWRYVPKAQMWKDFEERHPAPATEGRLMIDCYEYRMPSGSRLILAADLPVALLIGTSANGCGLGAVRLVPRAGESQRHSCRGSHRSWNLRAVVAGWLVARQTERAIEAYAPVGRTNRSHHRRRLCHGSDRVRAAR